MYLNKLGKYHVSRLYISNIFVIRDANIEFISELMDTLVNMVETYGDIVLFFALSNRYLLLRHPKDFEVNYATHPPGP